MERHIFIGNSTLDNTEINNMKSPRKESDRCRAVVDGEQCTRTIKVQSCGACDHHYKQMLKNIPLTMPRKYIRRKPVDVATYKPTRRRNK